MGPAATAKYVPLTIPQCCAHRPGAKCVQANACLSATQIILSRPKTRPQSPPIRRTFQDTSEKWRRWTRSCEEIYTPLHYQQWFYTTLTRSKLRSSPTPILVVISYCNSLTNNKVQHTELSGTAHRVVRYGTQLMSSTTHTVVTYVVM